MNNNNNNETISELRTIYRNHLFTESGQKQMRDAIRIKQEWKEMKTVEIPTQTKNINSKYIPDFLRDKMTCIEITPIGLNNMCHITTKIFADNVECVKNVLGFNITACPCKKIMSMELHSVNKIGETLYDFTRDYNDETSKFFIELDTVLTPKQYVQMYGTDPIVIDSGCKCHARKSGLRKFKMDTPTLKQHIEEITHLTVRDVSGAIIVNYNSR